MMNRLHPRPQTREPIALCLRPRWPSHVPEPPPPSARVARVSRRFCEGFNGVRGPAAQGFARVRDGFGRPYTHEKGCGEKGVSCS